MNNNFLPTKEHKQTIVNYLNSFSHASLLRYNNLDISYLYIYSAPIYLINLCDFQFDSLKNQQMFESLFISKIGCEKLKKLIDIKEFDGILSSIDNIFSYYLFSIEHTHFVVSFSENIISNINIKSLWAVVPRSCSSSYNQLIEDNSYILVNYLNNILT